MSRSRLLLLLFALLGAALLYAWLETPRQQRVAVETSAKVVDVAGQGSMAGERTVGLDFSGGKKLPYKKPKRDLFRSLHWEPKKAVVVVVEAVPEPEPEPEIIAPPPRPLNRPAALPKFAVKPIPPMKVLGSLTKGQSQSVFLASSQGEIYVVKRGERFADGILVRELTKKKIVLSRGLKDGGVTLPLVEGKIKSGRNSSFGAGASASPRRAIPAINTMNPQSPVPLVPPISGQGENKVDP